MAHEITVQNAADGNTSSGDVCRSGYALATRACLKQVMTVMPNEEN
ncbi:hypothetical protein HMPREF9551_00600 [Escherichia coli MS 196-1]|nr:hypothetical protein HMPREF9551_00600 [Escherichia coli MS 196-1]